MNILLLAPQHMNLYKSIVKQLKNEGNDVHVIFDKNISFDSYNHLFDNSAKRFIKKVIGTIIQNYSRYWKNKIRNDSKLSQKYDVFLCINGASVSPYLLNYLHNNNPKIRTTLYLWDNIDCYNFTRHFSYFDKIYTYDLRDSQRYHINFLPVFWVPTAFNKNLKPNQYALSIVGTNHDNRFEIVKKISLQLDAKKNAIQFHNS